MATTRIRYEQPTVSGNRSGWARTFTDIDDDVRGAKAFKGTYLRSGVEVDLEHGILIVVVFPTGSLKNGVDKAMFYTVTEDGLEEASEGCWEWRGEFLSVVEEGKRLLAKQRELKRYKFVVRQGIELFVTANSPSQALERSLLLFTGHGRYLCGDMAPVQAAAHITVTGEEIRQATCEEVTA